MDENSEIPWNTVQYIDVLQGMARLPSKSIELGFADPPFNIDLEKNVNSGKPFSRKKNEKISYYEDAMDLHSYKEWCSSWLAEMKRVCHKVIVYCGTPNVSMFCTIEKPLDMIIYFMKFNTIITPSSWAGRYRPLLIYADDKNTFLGRPKNQNNKFDSDVIVKTRQWFNEDEKNERPALIHPCPIDRDLIYKIFTQLKPLSMLDAFVGSGTVLRVAKEMGIQYIGFEACEKYKIDQDYLLNRARIRPIQKKVTSRSKKLF